MLYKTCPIPGVLLINLESIEDERGFFARIFCREDFARRGVIFQPVQANLSHNHQKGTLRGLHYQAAPHEEAKLVRAVKGAIHDVALDLRPGSPAYGQSFGVELSDKNRQALFIPKGCAHAYLTLTDDSEVLYLVDQAYAPQSGRGLRWNDPALDIAWPMKPEIVSNQDLSWPDFRTC